MLSSFCSRSHTTAASALIGEELYSKLSQAALALYTEAAQLALSKDIILADTKFEFGLVSDADGKETLILVDELLTPDSSRYWPLVGYEAGKPQPSFDKQYLRDWLAKAGFEKGLEAGKDGNGWVIDDEVVEGTRQRYEEVVQKLVD